MKTENEKKVVLPIDEIEVIEEEALLIKGGQSHIWEDSHMGTGNGCHCGCA